MQNQVRLLLAFIILLCGCGIGNTESKTDDKIADISIDKDSDWAGNFKMKIVDKKVIDSFNLYKVLAFDKGVPIGFKLKVPIKINRFGEGLEFQSMGDTSDHFLMSLASIYQINSKNKLVFSKKISCPYSGLNEITYKGNGQKRDTSIDYIKLFFEGKGEDEYAELYLNINQNNKTVEFEEKDIEYRAYILKFLSSQ